MLLKPESRLTKVNSHDENGAKTITSWKIQLFSSALIGTLFGLYHFITSNYEGWIFIYYFCFLFIESLIQWQAAKFIYKYTEKHFSWIDKPNSRILFTLGSGLIVSVIVIVVFEMLYTGIINPIFQISENDLSSQPDFNFASFVLDIIISFIILQLYLSLINMFNYFNELQKRKVFDAERHMENYFESLIQNIHDVILVVDVKGKVRYCSHSIEAITGYTVDEIKTYRPISSIINPSDLQRISIDLSLIADYQLTSYSTRFKIRTKTGELKHIETRITNAIEKDGLHGFITISSDITSQVIADQKANHQKELQVILVEISRQFLTGDLLCSSKKMLEDIGKFSQVDRAYIYLLSNDESRWNCFHEWRSDVASNVKSNFYQTGFLVSDSFWLFEQVTNNTVVNFNDVEFIPEIAKGFRQICKADQTRSVLILPLTRNGKVYGFMGYDSVIEQKEWQENDISTLRVCSEIFISSLMRTEAEKTIAQSLSVNKAIVESTSEGILLTDLSGNILSYNENFKEMWMLNDNALADLNETSALSQAIKNVLNAEEVLATINSAKNNLNDQVRLIAYMKNNRVLEGLSKPQIIDGKVVGRIWSNRDITERVSAEKEEIEKSIAQAQLESLRNQVNPHFLFNSLNVLSSLVHLDADLSEKFIDQLARSYRYLLEQKDNELVLLSTEIEFAKSFTFLLKIRFEDKLKISINIEEEALNCYVAPLTLQLLIENAVKHNIISTEAPLVIEIFNEGTESLIVSNNLQQRKQQLPSTGVGLKNIKNRYKLLTHKQPDFTETTEKYIAKIPLIKTGNND